MLLYSRRPSPFPLGRTVVEKDSLRKSPVEPGWLGDDGGSRKSILEGLYQDPGSPSDKQKKKKNEGEKKKNNNNNQGNYLWGLCKIQFSSNLRNQNCSILIQTTSEKSSFCKTECWHQHNQHTWGRGGGNRKQTKQTDKYSLSCGIGGVQIHFIIQILKARSPKPHAPPNTARMALTLKAIREKFNGQGSLFQNRDDTCNNISKERCFS